jgi:hypothetical protein
MEEKQTAQGQLNTASNSTRILHRPSMTQQLLVCLAAVNLKDAMGQMISRELVLCPMLSPLTAGVTVNLAHAPAHNTAFGMPQCTACACAAAAADSCPKNGSLPHCHLASRKRETGLAQLVCLSMLGCLLMPQTPCETRPDRHVSLDTLPKTSRQSRVPECPGICHVCPVGATAG